MPKHYKKSKPDFEREGLLGKINIYMFSSEKRHKLVNRIVIAVFGLVAFIPIGFMLFDSFYHQQYVSLGKSLSSFFGLKLWYFLLIGSSSIILAIGMLIHGIKFRRKSELTTGVVVDLIVKQGEDSSSSSDPEDQFLAYYPVIEYKTREGKTLHYISENGSNPAVYKIDEQVQLYYDPLYPAKVQIKNFLEQGLSIFCFGFIGIIFVGLSYFIR